ncbi:ABC transporter ATP-binding protein [Bacillus infantis]|uniref:ABC transporter ATP-binding protein n=1 Tax=Bacillus infantis TaxID=324767 RepID=UPI0016539A9A|nr:ABC transporter ATP-binding protein [Bacillus infantis]
MSIQASLVSVNNVSRKFGSQYVLTGLSLTIRQGEIYGLLGPSGAGKTTLIKQIAGLDIPNAGDITIFGEKVPSLSLLERIGYMAQSDALYGELTAAENLRFFASLYGLKGTRKKERMLESMQVVGLSEHMDKLVSNYSGGMKRRLSLAISLLHEPELLILDEPTVGIDPVLRQSIWSAFQELKHKGKTLIITTHVMDEAEKCDRLGLLRDGRLIASGSPAELKAEKNAITIEEAFLAYGGEQR